MRKKILFILTIFISFIFVTNVKAASANISVSSSSSRVIVGNNVTVTVKISSSTALGSWQFDVVPSNNLTFVSSSFGGLYIKDVVSSSNQKSKTYTFVFKAKSSGNATVSIKNSGAFSYNEETLSTSNGSTSFKTMTQAELENSYSKNNNLKSLTIEGYEINFNKDTLEYTLEVENEITSLNISATKEDSTASISGTGAINISEGLNAIKVVVTAQNGSTKTYTINVTVKELSPIEVSVDDKKYTIVRKREALPTVSRFYEESELDINGEKIPGYHNSVVKYDLVGLKNEAGEVKLFIFKDGNYQPYFEYTLNQLTVVPLNEKTDIPVGYKETTININGEVIVAYSKEGNPYPLIYVLNIENGEKHLYRFDSEEETLQKFVEDSNKEQLYFYIIIGMFGFTVVSYIIFISCLLKKNTKRVKKIAQTMAIDIKEIKKEKDKKQLKEKKIKQKELKNKEKNDKDEMAEL